MNNKLNEGINKLHKSMQLLEEAKASLSKVSLSSESQPQVPLSTQHESSLQFIINLIQSFITYLLQNHDGKSNNV